MQYVGETFLFPVVDGKSLGSSGVTSQNFYPCNGATLPLDQDRWGSVPVLAYLIGPSADGKSLTLPSLTSPVPGLAWFIAGTGVFPSGRVDPDDWMPLLGQISVFPTSPAQRQYSARELLPCDGRELDLDSYAALGYLLGTTFGGDGTRTFALPNIPPPGPGLFFGMCTNGAFPQLVPYSAEVPG